MKKQIMNRRRFIPSCRRDATRLLAVAVLVGMSGAFGGCTSGAETDVAACAGPGVTAEEIRFGLMYPDTGSTAEAFSLFRAGVDARIGEQNAQGGIDGRRLAYDWEDDRNSADQSLAAARSLAGDDRVFGIVQLNANIETSTWLQDEGIPAVAALSAGQASYDNVFAVSTYFPETSWGRFVGQQGGTSAAVLSLGLNPAYWQVKNAVIDSLLGTGINVVYSRDVSEIDNFSNVAAEIAASGADTLVVGAPPAIFAAALQAIRAADVPIRVPVGVLGYDPNLLDQIGPQIAGGVIAVSSAPFELDLPTHRRFLEAMRQYAPYIDSPAQQVALQGWMATDMFILGLGQSGSCPSRLGFITGLGKVEQYNADGLLPPLDLSSALRQNPCYYFVQITPDGRRFETLQPAPLCGSSS